MNRMLAQRSYRPLSRERYVDVFDFPVRTYYSRVGIDLETHDFETLSDEFCAAFEDRLKLATLFPDTRKVLQHHRSRGDRQFMLSNTHADALARMIGQYQLAEFFDATVGASDNFAAGKSELGKSLLCAHDIDPRAAVLVGDTLHDAEVAHNMGVDCILVATGHHAKHRLVGSGCPVLDGLDELGALFA